MQDLSGLESVNESEREIDHAPMAKTQPLVFKNSYPLVTSPSHSNKSPTRKFDTRRSNKNIRNKTLMKPQDDFKISQMGKKKVGFTSRETEIFGSGLGGLYLSSQINSRMEELCSLSE